MSKRPEHIAQVQKMMQSVSILNCNKPDPPTTSSDDVPTSLTDVPSSMTNVPSSLTDVPSSLTNVPSKLTEMEVCSDAKAVLATVPKKLPLRVDTSYYSNQKETKEESHEDVAPTVSTLLPVLNKQEVKLKKSRKYEEMDMKISKTKFEHINGVEAWMFAEDDISLMTQSPDNCKSTELLFANHRDNPWLFEADSKLPAGAVLHVQEEIDEGTITGKYQCVPKETMITNDDVTL
jgi:hypothetical protein